MNAESNATRRVMETAAVVALLWLLVACTPAAPADAPTDTPPPVPTSTPTRPPPTSTPLPTPTEIPTRPVTLTFIHMTDRMNGWAFGDYGPLPERVLRTSDGGQTWQDVTPPEAPSDRDDASKQAVGTFPDAQMAWVTYQFDPFFYFPDSVIVWLTTDGGQTWTASEPAAVSPLAEFFDLSDFSSVDEGTGYFLAHIGAGMNHDYLGIYRTTTAGESWTLVADPTTAPDIQGCSKTGLALAGADWGWLAVDCRGVIDRPIIFVTEDGGVTWAQEDLPAPADAPDLFTQAFCGVISPYRFSEGEGRLVLSCPLREDLDRGQDYLYSTGDGGASWTTSPFPGGKAYWLDSSTGWALWQQLHRTLDGGETWTAMSSVAWDGQYSFVDQDAGWVVAEQNGELSFWTTADGGQTWDQIAPSVIPK